jgi:hypothetical protein
MILARSVAEKRASELNESLNSEIKAVIHCKKCWENPDNPSDYFHVDTENHKGTIVKTGEKKCLIAYYNYTPTISAEIKKGTPEEYSAKAIYQDNVLDVRFVDNQCTDCSKYIDNSLADAFLCEEDWLGDEGYMNLLFDKIEDCLDIKPLNNEASVVQTEFRDNPTEHTEEILNGIRTCLASEYYGDIKFCVKVEMPEGLHTLKSPSLVNETEAEVILEYDLTDPGFLTVKIDVTDNFLVNDVTDFFMRMHEYDESLTIEQVQQIRQETLNVLRNIAVLMEMRVNDMILGQSTDLKKPEEFLSLTQLIIKNAKHIWQNGTVLEGMWYKRDELYPQIPEYANLGPVTCGLIDENLNSALAVPLMAKFATELISDKTKLEEFKLIFTKEGVELILNAFIDEVKQTIIYEDKTDYYLTRASVQIACALITTGVTSESSYATKGPGLVKRISNILSKTLHNCATLKNRIWKLTRTGKKGVLVIYDRLILKVGSNDLLQQLDNILARVPESKLDDLVTDIDASTGLFNKFDAEPEALGSWEALNNAGRTGGNNPSNGLTRNIDAIDALTTLRNNPRLAIHEVPDDVLAYMLKEGWGSKPAVPAYADLCSDVNNLVDMLPQNTGSNLFEFLGTKGLNNGGADTRRHAYVQLQRLLESENRIVITGVKEVRFENRLSNIINGTDHVSYTDVRITRFDNSIIEIETKAGLMLFESGISDQFAKQTFNSLQEVSRLEDYKVFLNNEIRAKLVASIDKKKVITAWERFENGALLKDAKIQQLIKNYGEARGYDFTINTVTDFLKQNDDWFIDIFKSNLL